ncbi:magnesium/cobalt transporter CorA [Paenibacillus tarimensis]
MLRTFAVTRDYKVLGDVPVEQLHTPDIAWFWVDFDRPTDEEIKLLDEYFHFHPLAIEDCIHFLQRPKLDHYDEDYHFFVLHRINPRDLSAEEIDLFLGERYVVSYHNKAAPEIEEVISKFLVHSQGADKGPVYLAYFILDKIVDHYFPGLYQIEDELNELDQNSEGVSTGKLMDQVFDIRADLLKLRRTIFPMRDLLYRMINSDRIKGIRTHIAYFTDIYDHLLKLSEMVESNREMTNDMRDSYISLNTNRLNNIMKTLTVITTIFMPLTFIAGIYGMNFDVMPELHWKSGYFIVLLLMLLLGSGMYMWFRKKGWFE